MNTIIYLLVFLGGLTTLLGAILNWEGMYRSRRAKGIVSTLGLQGARIFYGVVGVFIMGAAIVGYFDLLG
jgi:hypothetical protein